MSVVINIQLPNEKQSTKEDLKNRLMNLRPAKPVQPDNSSVVSKLNDIYKRLDVPRHIGGSV